MQASTTPIDRRVYPKALLLVLLTLVCYIPSLSNGFIWDDDGYVQGNPTLRSVQGLVDIWTLRGATPQYYPLVHSTFWVEFQTWGLWAPGYHATNLLLHIGVCLLWWLLLTRLGLSRIAYLAALVYAVHPIHVETVCWITERKNVLSLLCYLLAALCYLRFTGYSEPDRVDLIRRGTRQWLWYLLAMICFIGALLSKTVTCTLPAALVLVMWVRSCDMTDSFKTVLKKLPWKQLFLLLPFFIVGITLARITISMETNEVGASGMAWGQSLPERIIIYSRVVLFYCRKGMVPDVFMFNYPRWVIDGQNLVLYLFPTLLLGLLITLWCLRKRITLWPLAAMLFSIGTLLPASGLFDVYPMRFSFVADHFAYHATMGFIAIGVAIIVSLTHRLHKVTGKAVVTVMLLGLMVQTMRYTPAYANWFTLFTDTLAKNPDSWMAYNYRGVAFEKQYDLTHDQAMLQYAYDDYRNGLKLHQDFAQLYANYGSVMIKQGDPGNAITQLKRAIQLQPDLPQAHYWYGLALDQTGDLAGAVTHYQQAFELFPGYVSAWHHMARTLAKLGEITRATAAYEQAIALRPQSPAAYQELGLLLLKHGEYAKALEMFDAAYRLRPNEPTVLWSKGLALYMAGDTAGAITLLKQAHAAMPGDTALRLDLAWILVTCPEMKLRDPVLAEQLIKPLPDSARRQLVLDAMRALDVIFERRLMSQM